jgi:erythromycin esterase-like protein
MGSELRRRFGRGYLSVGFVFGQGAYRTVEVRDGRAILVEHTIGPGTSADASAPFVATRTPVLVADLRKLPPGPAARWFAAPHPLREAGGTFASDEDMIDTAVLSSRHDIIVFVARMTASTPIAAPPHAPEAR